MQMNTGKDTDRASDKDIASDIHSDREMDRDIQGFGCVILDISKKFNPISISPIVGPCHLHSHIGSDNIRLGPIYLITVPFECLLVTITTEGGPRK